MNENWRFLMLLDILHFNSWSRMIDDYLIEPYMVANHIGGIQYADFRERALPNLLEDIPLRVHKGMWFHHYTASP
jgi:hypothetical protein